jgi:hypothetical protein
MEQQTILPTTVHLIPSRAQQWIVTQHAINLLTIQEKVLMNTMCTPRILHGGRDDSILSAKLIRIAPETSSF